MARTYHLWRSYPNPPYFRWACDLIPARSKAVGYEMVAHDVNVADYQFLADMAKTFSGPIEGVTQAPSEPGTRSMMLTRYQPGQPGFFEQAVRRIPNGVLRSTGKPAPSGQE